MAMTRKDYNFLAKIMREQIEASTQGSMGERIRMQTFRRMVVLIDSNYKNFDADMFLKAAGIADTTEK